MTIPDYQSLMLPVLQAATQGEVKLGDVVTSLAQTLGLTDEESAQLLPSGRQATFAHRVGWAKFGLSKAKLIESTRRGYFRMTDQGREVLRSSPTHIDNAFLLQFDAFKRFKESMKEQQEASEICSNVETHTPDEVMRSAHQQIDAALAQELLDRTIANPPDFFERLIVNLLISMGYGGSAQDAGRALGRSGDNGVDGVIDQDALGLDRVYIQAKRYVPGNSIGSGDIRNFFGSLDRHKASKGIFVTTSTFSSSAKETAEYLSKRIVLIDGTLLAKLMIRYNVGCRVEETLYLKKIDEEFFE